MFELDYMAAKVSVNCQQCGKELVKQFEADAHFLENDDLVCECGNSYLVTKPAVYDEYDESEVRVVFHCNECGSLLNAWFVMDDDDDEYPDHDQVECSCGTWYEVKLPSLPTVMKDE